ncbi:MAG: AsmA family protein, partial [Bacteroidetes bacterium]|nr:AsmA family protein [Bacteroidota bacterium]
MKKIIKWIFILVFLLLITIVALPFVFKGKIVELVKTEANKKLNATLYFDNDISLGLFKSFPNFNITVNNLSLANKGKFQGDTLISAKEFSATLDIMSVINGDKIQIKKIYLKEPRIQARVLADGSANWDVTIPDTLVKTPEDTAESKFKLGLKELKIDDAYIVYDDKSIGFYTELTHMNHELSGDFTQDNFVLKTLTDMEAFTMSYGGIPYISKAKTKLDAAIDMDMKNFKFTFKENIVNLNELALGVDGFFAMPGNDMDMDLKFNCKQTDFKNILSMIPAIYTHDFNTIKVSGKMGLNGFVKGIYNDTRMPAFGAELTVANGAFAYPSMPSDVKNINIDLKVQNPDGVPDHTFINLASAHAEIGSNPIDARVTVKTPVSDADIDAVVKGKIILDEIVKIVPFDKGTNLSGTIIADLTAKGRMSAITNKQYQNFNAGGTLMAQQLKYQSPSFTQGITISNMKMDFAPSYVNLTEFQSTIGGSDMA